MIDQKKILGHREPYNGMGEDVGLLHQMQNQQRPGGKTNYRSRKNQSRDRETGIKSQGSGSRNSKDIKRHQENAPKKEQAGRITYDKIRQSTHATRTPTPSQVRSHARQHKDKASPKSPGAQIQPPTLIVQP